VSDLDGIWIEAAARLAMPVVRGGDAYVHWDGRTLHIAEDRELDADDTVAQLVLHEMCHSLVEGPTAARVPDWGLDNTTNEDAVREAGAVRLQAHLLGAYGLRDVLFPTTPVRAFFESLPQDALSPAEEPSSQLARLGAARAAATPWRGPLEEALRLTADRLAHPRHARSGFPLSARELSCGDCGWRTAGGFCRQAPTRVRVAADLRACVRWETLDCRACAACCRHAYDSVPLGRRDLLRKTHPELVVERDGYLELARAGDRCAALAGATAGPFTCTVYEERPRPCRDFELGGRHCLTARRRVGLTV
jgi:hypothetical protein